MIDDTLAMVEVLKAQAKADEHYTKRCVFCGEYIVFVEAMKAVAPGHVYSQGGLKDVQIVGCCEYCFDEMHTDEDEDEEMTATPIDNPLPGQITAVVPDLDFGDSSRMENDAQRYSIEMDYDRADVITSAVASKFGKAVHKPVIDIDFPVKALPSSNPEHSHLYIDKELTWDQYQELLEVMVKVGLVEPGYLGASRERGFTAVRKPGKLKPGTPSETSLEELLDLAAPPVTAPWDAPTRKAY